MNVTLHFTQARVTKESWVEEERLRSRSKELYSVHWLLVNITLHTNHARDWNRSLDGYRRVSFPPITGQCAGTIKREQADTASTTLTPPVLSWTT